jgi:NhaP-type Na+/H+ or K+/H+ antiporter
MNEGGFEGQAAELWAVAGFTVLVSILLHGTTVTPAMRSLDARRRARDIPSQGTSQALQ